MVVILTETCRYTIIKHRTVFVQHQSIAAAARLQLIPGVGIDHVQQFLCVTALDINLAQGGRIQNAHRLARRQAFSLYRLMHGFPGFGKIKRALPVADILKHRPCFFMARMHRGLAFLQEELTTFMTDNGTERERGIRRSERGCAHFRDGFLANFRHYCQRIDIGSLALVCPHAGCGVTLQVFYREEPFPCGKRDIRHRCIVMQLMEMLLRANANRMIGGQDPQRAHFRLPGLENGRYLCGCCFGEPGRFSGRSASLSAFFQAAMKIPCGLTGAGFITVVILRAILGHKAVQVIAILKLAFRLTVEMYRRCPATGNPNQVAIQVGGSAADIATVTGQSHGADSLDRIGAELHCSNRAVV